MRLRIHFLRLEVETSEGRFCFETRFTSGANVLRADNSAGKSTAMMAILYGLGLEGMLSPGHDAPFAHALTTWLEEDGISFPVVESRVWLELSGIKGTPMTICRQVKGGDPRLVQAWIDAGIGNLEQGERKDFFVRLGGAAKRQSGFHHQLAEFMGADLPSVPTYDGREVSLYLECLAPQFFVEQKEGWSPIWGRYPTWLRVRDVHARAMEYLLRLDRVESAAKRERLRAERRRLEADWGSLVKEIRTRANSVGLKALGVPSELVTDERIITVRIVRPSAGADGQLEHRQFDTMVLETKQRIAELRAQPVPDAAGVSTELDAELFTVRETLKAKGLELSVLLSRDAELTVEVRAIDARISGVRADIQRYEDLSRLRKLGSELQLSMAKNTCPTCSQGVSGTLLPDAQNRNSLSEEDSEAYLRDKERVYRLFRRQLQEQRDETDELLAVVHRTVKQLQRRAASIEESLFADRRLPARADIEAYIVLEADLERMTAVVGHVGELANGLRRLAADGRRVDAALKMIRPKTSGRDERVETFIANQFPLLCEEFGVAQLEARGLSIEADTFRPIGHGHRSTLQFELSASDGVRSAWAYRLVGLMASARFAGSHPGFLVLDEPKQQSARTSSFVNLIRRIGTVAEELDVQIIVATSEENVSALKSASASVHWIEAPAGKLLRRLDSGQHED